MTETEQLKKNTEHTHYHQQMKEIVVYLDVLLARIESAEKRRTLASWVYLISWIAWVTLDTFVPSLKGFWVLLFIAGIFYQNHVSTKIYRAYSEFFGAMKILEIIGLVGDEEPPGSKKKRSVISEYTEVVKGWFTKKKDAQDKVYAPT